MSGVLRSGSVGRNVFANFAGTAWSALLTLAVLPVYLHLLGAELYGLIGFYASLQTLLVILDLGFGTVSNREAARHAAGESDPTRFRTLVRTLEAAYWAVAALLGVMLIALSPLIASRWLHPVHVSEVAISRGLAVMAVVLALQLPYSLYAGVVFGLQRHVALNVCLIVGATLRLLGPIPVLLIVGPSITWFFAIQAAAMAVQTFSVRMLMSRIMPASTGRAAFDFSEVRRVGRFAAGVTVMNGLSMIVMQSDRLIVSRTATLQMFGYYAIAAAAATAATVLSGPVAAAAFPKFAQLVAGKKTEELAALYETSMQMLGALLIPVCGVIALFAGDLLLLWTRRPPVATNAALPLALLAIGMGAAALGYLPQYLQLAAGWTSFAIRLNAAGLIILVPSLLAAAHYRGPTGVAATWMAWQVVAFVATTIAVSGRLLQGRGVRITSELLRPLAATAVVILAAAFIHPQTWPARIALMVVTAAIAQVASIIVTPAARQWAGRALHRTGAPQA